MAIKIGKLFGTDKLVGTDDDDLLIALGAKTTLIGGLGNDVLLGGLNNDTLIGGKGADYLSGGLGTDTVDYSGSDAGVKVNLTTGKGSGGDAEGDTIVLVENVIGSAFDDVLTGDKGKNVLTGGDGDDIFVVTKGKDVITDFTPGTGTPGTEVVIDFDTPVLEPFTPVFIPVDYLGLGWSNYIYRIDPAPAFGYMALKDYEGDHVAFNTTLVGGGFATVSFSSPSSADFDLKSMDIGGGWSDKVKVRIDVYDDGTVVGSLTLEADSGRFAVDFADKSVVGGTATTSAFTGRFTSIDKVEFVPLGLDNFSFDDIKIVYPGTLGGGDKIDVSDGTDIAALVASAVSNGKGGAMLTHAAGTLELLGVDPGSVAADWFF